ncbi:unnamed protein product [Cladocopium goreaui]|uniref:Uncharacterized protein n=1 Tax=Cladocopium goreaui TaxID=2562237 RepID=A0A9P1C1R3_9DINO|nr:unnamed protein product [Cladocopium goreaui]
MSQSDDVLGRDSQSQRQGYMQKKLEVHLSDLSTELMALKECLVFSLDPALEQWITWMLSFDVELIQSSYNLPLTSFDTL